MGGDLFRMVSMAVSRYAERDLTDYRHRPGHRPNKLEKAR